MAISKIKIGSTEHALEATKLVNTRYIDGVSFTGEANVTRYATCSTAAATAAKTASITAGTFSLITGARVTVKFTNANSAASPTLNVGSTGAKAIYWHGAAIVSSQYWEAGAVLDFVYNGTQWELVGVAKDNNTTYWSSCVNCTTAAATAAKTGSCSFYDLAANRYIYVMVRYANTVQGAITFNVNSKGAKPIYINGTASSSSNYTLPAGMYFVFYDGTNYHFRTDNWIQGYIAYASRLATARTIDGVSFNGSENIIHYGTCSTAAATTAKTVACTGFTLATGSTIKVRFTVTNTGAVGSLTLNVNSTGAKSIKYRNGNLPSAGTLAANRTYEFVYDGTYYQLMGDLDTNTTYTHPTTAGNKHIPSGGSSGQILRWSADGTAAWGADNNTVYTHPTSGVTAGTYDSVTVDANGHVTAGSSPTQAVNKGGTGRTTLTSGYFLRGNGTSAVTMTKPADVLSAIGAAPAYQYSNTDLTAGTSDLATGKLYFVYE